ncbi:DUF3306 domain-containing protein [Roseovarius aestuariivivens]|uniref:DUF3306 domain-containing protein n=1 Tax=Roseovarius aestuariivivens TaxID=1888910 RepID=UPI0010815490|nr:DUF3306 domain-containing protein [Roseovarius aestuariivivens]
MSRGGDFWSRRKAQVEAEERAEAKAREAAELAARDEALKEKTDEEILEDLGLPDPDTLGEGADFKAFMAKAVPDRIRRRALRRLWLSNPALANLDGLLDYGEDFTDKATVVENLQTAYQVGKGMMAHVEELARQDAAREAGEDPFARPGRDEAPEDTAEADAEADDTPETEAETDANSPLAAVQDDPVAHGEDVAEDAGPRRRMRFAFEDHAGGTA